MLLFSDKLTQLLLYSLLKNTLPEETVSVLTRPQTEQFKTHIMEGAHLEVVLAPALTCSPCPTHCSPGNALLLSPPPLQQP